MVAASQPYTNEPHFLGDDRLDMRLNLIQEEFDELIEATNDKDEIAERDAIGDMIYVIVGLAHERGYGHKLAEDFALIHESNMSKFCVSEDEAKQTVAMYAGKNIETHYALNQKTGLWVIYRSEDDKVLKSINYKAVQLK